MRTSSVIAIVVSLLGADTLVRARSVPADVNATTQSATTEQHPSGLVALATEFRQCVYCAVKFAEGSLKPAELEAHMMKSVPLMDPFVAKP